MEKAAITSTSGELKLFCGLESRKARKVNVQGWTFSKKDGPEGANRRFATEGQFPSPPNNNFP
jgi:hypothetical protein